jgi:CheY-like chemotaxis protein
MTVAPPDLQVLIVDDEIAVVEEFAAGLRRRAYNVLTATSGAEALALLAARRDIGVAVCDIRMPALDGHSFAERVAALNETGAVTEVILISGHGTYEDEALARRHGVFAFLTKPFLGSELRAELSGALARSVARRQGSGKAENA